jgi:hypothetical protein
MCTLELDVCSYSRSDGIFSVKATKVCAGASVRPTAGRAQSHDDSFTKNIERFAGRGQPPDDTCWREACIEPVIVTGRRRRAERCGWKNL